MRFGVEVDSVELAGRHTVATAEASVRTSLFTGEQGVGEGAGECGVVERLHGRVLAGAVAAHHGDLRFMLDGTQVHDFGNLGGIAARTISHIEVIVLHNSLSHGTTAGKSAAAAIGVGQTSLDQINARILFHMEEL